MDLNKAASSVQRAHSLAERAEPAVHCGVTSETIRVYREGEQLTAPGTREVSCSRGSCSRL